MNGTNKKIKKQNINGFDERQRLERLKAIRLSFFVLCGYLFINSFLSIFKIEWADTSTLCMTGLLLSCLAGMEYMICKGAYLRISDSVKLMLIPLALCSIIYIYIIADTLIETRMYADGFSAMDLFPLAFGLYWILITITLFFKEIILKKKTKTGEADEER